MKDMKQKDFVPFHSRSDELTVESGCILWGYRTIVPTKLRKQILLDLHRSHMGIVKTKALARSYVWWPRLDHDVEQLVKGCNSCQLLQRNPNKSVLIPWKPTHSAWSRVHMDYAGPIKGFYILIIVDSYSKWVEAFLTKTITSCFTIKKLRETLCRYGLIDTLVTDNGTQFTSAEFKHFAKMNRFDHVFTAPGHPATNGQAENSVKTTKHSIEACLREPNSENLEIILNRFLIDFRNTPHCTTGESPAKLFFGRTLKTRFSLLKPPLVTEQIEKSQEKNIRNHGGKREAHFKIGNKVVIRDYTNPNKPGWVPAGVGSCKKLGERHYDCLMSHNGRMIKRHLNQIRETISTNENDREADSSKTDALNETLASETQNTSNEIQASVTDVNSGLSGGDVTVDTSLNSTLISVSDSSDDSFRDAISNTPENRHVRASARIAMDRMADARRQNLI